MIIASGGNSAPLPLPCPNAPSQTAVSTRRRGTLAWTGSLLAVLSAAFVATPAQAVPYAYSSTLGQTAVAGADAGHFNFLGRSTVDTVHGRLLVADVGNQRVQIYDSATLAYVGTIGATGVAGGDNGHLDQPVDVGFDAANDRILVADQGNQRVQVFDAQSFAYIATIGAAGVAGGDNAHFSLPASVKVNPDAGQIYVADALNHRVQIFNAQSLAYVATLGTSGVAGADASHLSEPADAEYNPVLNQIMVADLDNARVQFYDAASLQPLSQLGVTGSPDTDNAHFDLPVSVTFDPMGKLILVADGSSSNRVQIYSATTYRFIATLGTTAAGADSNHFAGPFGISVDPVHSRIFVGDSENNRLQIFTALPTPLVTSVLPGARSVQIGATPTMFANILNVGTTPLSNCGVALPASSPAGLSIQFRTTDPATNTAIGTTGVAASLAAAPAGSVSVQTFVLAFDSGAALARTGLPLEFACDGVAPATVMPGVNNADLIFSTSPVADVIALAATAKNDGIVHVPAGGSGAFAVASINIGVAGNLIVAADTGGVSLPLTANICESQANGQCLAAPASSLPITYAAGATPTFSVFITASGSIPLAAATSRIFVKFLDGAGALHGETSVAVETQ
ncbi:MAG TPA: NHL repeat-containing protein [Aliidongia sp.]|nr:NHL repeat-containing protein [Aliidongia sp.]